MALGPQLYFCPNFHVAKIFKPLPTYPLGGFRLISK